MKNRLLVGATAVAVLVGGGAAFAVADPIAGGIDAGTTVSVATTSTTAAPTPETSEALRQSVIERVALLRAPATKDDQAPADYVPPTDPRNGLSLTRDDLAFGRKLPGPDASWVIPLKTGGLAIISRAGGAQYAPEQLENGTVLSKKVNPDGSGSVVGVVPDGTREVSLAAPDGTQTVQLSGNAYQQSFGTKTDEPTSISIDAGKGRRDSKVASY